MRRSNRRVPQPMFRGNELPRLLTMIVMLGVMFMLMNRARDPNTWRWLTNGPASSDSGASQITGTDGGSHEQLPAEPTEWALGGPTDQDPEEADAAREEFQAITDKAPLQKEEMPAYWRLLKWVDHQPLALLEGRAPKDVLFTNLVETPDKFRGKLVHLRLHLMRALTYEAEDSPIGIERLYEAWGWTDESQPWPYVVVFPELPPGMTLGPDIREEASFNGYFLKLMSYEAHDTHRYAPLLAGRIVWHPVRVAQGSNVEWFWPTFLAGGLIFVLLIARWTLNLGSRPPRPRASSVGTSGVSIETWLTQAQTGEPSSDLSGDRDSGREESDSKGPLL